MYAPGITSAIDDQVIIFDQGQTLPTSFPAPIAGSAASEVWTFDNLIQRGKGKALKPLRFRAIFWRRRSESNR